MSSWSVRDSNDAIPIDRVEDDVASSIILFLAKGVARITSECNGEALAVEGKCRKGKPLLSLHIADTEILLPKLVSTVEQEVDAQRMHSKNSRISIFDTREGREREAIEVQRSLKYSTSPPPCIPVYTARVNTDYRTEHLKFWLFLPVINRAMKKRPGIRTAQRLQTDLHWMADLTSAKDFQQQHLVDNGCDLIFFAPVSSFSDDILHCRPL